LFLQGLFILLTLQMIGRLVLGLNEPKSDRTSPRPSIFPPSSAFLRDDLLSKKRVQFIAMGLLAFGALQAINLLIAGAPGAAWIPLVLLTLGSYFYSAEPVSLRTTGMGELALSLMTGLIPLFSFILLTGEVHRFVLMTSVPLAALAFAAQVVLALPCYAYDEKHNRRNLLTRLGWQKAMWLHDLAILLSVVSLGIAALSGLPDRVVLGTILSTPLAILQLYQIRRIQRGEPPKYRLFAYSAISLYALTTYFMLLGFLF